jgi:serine/threonine protein kinase
MPIGPGTRVGPYEVAALLGQGGMGQVYRATDTNLKRSVAIKVLPSALAADTERLARFQREAELLARLNHPNIAQIHGLERSVGTIALVMELVEGPTLADRILHGPIPIDEALALAKQIAAALEAAHEQGIVHRDLKPANVKVKADDSVKVLDFGLAKALESPASPPDWSQSPTMSGVVTRAGVILGTSAYMSPEQARGLAIDKRTDIWAFGCVLYEMLTGHQAFRARRSLTRLRRFSSGNPTGVMSRQRLRGACGDSCSAACRKMRASVCTTSPTRGWRLNRGPANRQWRLGGSVSRRACGCSRVCSQSPSLQPPSRPAVGSTVARLKRQCCRRRSSHRRSHSKMSFRQRCCLPTGVLLLFRRQMRRDRSHLGQTARFGCGPRAAMH